MSSIKVVSINEKAKQEAVEEQVEIEETKEEVVEPTNKVVVNTPVEEPKEEIKETKTDAKQVQCPKCFKYMSNKNFRYRHEKLCSTEPKPVKPQAKPKGKSKPKTQPIVQEVAESPQPVQNQIIKPAPPPRNPLSDITNHYQLLHQQYVQQKKEKYDALCKNMFSTKSKKR